MPSEGEEIRGRLRVVSLKYAHIGRVMEFSTTFLIRKDFGATHSIRYKGEP